LINIMKEKNFIFLGVNNLKNNAFFINKNYQNLFKKIILGINSKLENYVNHDFKESRDKRGKLTNLSSEEQLKEIKDCQVVDIKKSLVEEVKLSELFKI